MNAVTSPMMTEADAVLTIERIRRHSGVIRALLVELDERQGWKALGYATMRACVEAEFDLSSSHLYRELAAAEVEKNIHSPLGEYRETWLRPLTAFTPDVQALALLAAQAAFPGEPLTARKIKATANVLHDAELTGGKVDIGDGTMTALGAAITLEAYEIGERQRAHIAASSVPPLAVVDAVLYDVSSSTITLHANPESIARLHDLLCQHMTRVRLIVKAGQS